MKAATAGDSQEASHEQSSNSDDVLDAEFEEVDEQK